LIVANDMVFDSRVDRHAETLGASGHDVTVLCIQTLRTAPMEIRPRFKIVRKRDFLRKLFEHRMQAKAASKSGPNWADGSGRTSALRSFVRTLSQISLAVTFDVMMIHSARQLDADIYICNDLYTLRVGAFMKAFGRRVIYDSHELYPDLAAGTPPYVRKLTRNIESFLIRFADTVTTVNEFIASELSSRYGIPSPTVIMNCPRTPASLPETRRRPTGRKVVLYSGTLWQERGLENVVLACRYLRKDVRVVFRGEGAIEAKLREMARGLENCVIEKPVPMAEVIPRAAEADVGMVPYLPTTLNNLYASPNKLFEYLQAGIPVIGSDAPFIRKIIVGHDVGLVFDPSDPKDIAKAMNLITQDEILEEKRANVKKIRSRYSWEIEAKKLLDAVSSLSYRSTAKRANVSDSLDRPP